MNRASTCLSENSFNVRIVFGSGVLHLVNDMLPMCVISIYPLIKNNLGLTYTQLGILTLVFQLVGSILQPFLGYICDKRPQPYMLTLGMLSNLGGIVFIAFGTTFFHMLAGIALIGLGSATFHPEATRISQLAAGTRPGLAQSIFQLGGNSGSALGPLIAALVLVPKGQKSFIFLLAIVLVAFIVLRRLTLWYSAKLEALKSAPPKTFIGEDISRFKKIMVITILLVLTFSKFAYINCFSNYYVFYLSHKFNMEIDMSEICLFIFLASIALGTMIGGPIGDRFGRRCIIWASILGVIPFSLALPYVGISATIILSTISGVLVASAFPAILVYAQEMMPRNIGTVSGLFFGFAFGVAGLSALILGYVSDHYGILRVYEICSILPIVGVLALFLPNIKPKRC